jgi:hypothetical protein
MKKAYIPTLFFLLLTIASPAIGTWNSLPNVPATGRANGIAFSINNLVYMGTGALIGTFGNVNCFDDLWSYDPATNIWSQRASYPGGPVSIFILHLRPKY